MAPKSKRTVVLDDDTKTNDSIDDAPTIDNNDNNIVDAEFEEIKEDNNDNKEEN